MFNMCTRRQRFVLRHGHYRILLVTGCILLSLTILIYFICFPKNNAPKIFIVEEHHEALAYWFHAADQGIIPKTKNILIHIDAHSDESTPEYIRGMPTFRYPKNEDEISYFLQKNDVFIQGAVMTGLISRLIWVWPSWDKRLLAEKEPYESKMVELGWLVASKSHYGTTAEPRFCQCEIPLMPRKDYAKKCSYIDVNATNVDEQETEIMPDSCQIVTSYLSEHVNEQFFVSRFASNRRWDHNETVIVDIDEDYFGCENAANSLVKDGLSWSTVESIDEKLRQFLCPKFGIHEEIGDNFLRLLLDEFLKACEEDLDCTGSDSIGDLLSRAYETLVSEFRRHPSLFCGRNDFDVRDLWQELAEIFYNMPTQHVKKIRDLGFCFSTSPKTLFFEVGRGEFTVCHGLNPPNVTIVFLHTPDDMEIDNQRNTLLEITRSAWRSRNSPIVTLCRSVRDGFTPRALAGFIEAGILETLAMSLDGGDWEISYDDDLFGGRKGWSHRN